jgi:thymidylate synthase
MLNETSSHHTSMYISHNTLDDLLHEILTTLLNEQQVVRATKGEFRELFGCCLHLKNPRARLSRSESKGKVFSALGELFWYLSGDTRLDFIDYYVPGRFHEESDDKVRVRSGYGDRLNSFRGMNQLQNVIDLLNEKPTSRRAVIQLFDATDLTEHYASIPCTCTLQFIARDSRLHLFVSMRSNDAFIGLPHDIFSFTMLQEIVARSVGLEVGEYKHCAGSLHLYDHDIDRAKNYLKERWQSSISMPPMPQGNPWESIKELQHIEESFRLDQFTDIDNSHLGEYWKDLARLMHAFRSAKNKNTAELATVIGRMHSDVYKMFAQVRLDTLTHQN